MVLARIVLEVTHWWELLLFAVIAGFSGGLAIAAFDHLTGKDTR